jgi:hypothetical protein
LAIISGCDTPEVLDAAEETFDAIAGLVEGLVVSVLDLAVPLRRNDGLGPTCFDEVAQLVAVVTSVRNDCGGFRCCLDARFGGDIIADIAGSQNQDDWATFVVGDSVNLAVAASARVAYAAIRAPFLRPLPAVR